MRNVIPVLFLFVLSSFAFQLQAQPALITPQPTLVCSSQTFSISLPTGATFQGWGIAPVINQPTYASLSSSGTTATVSWVADGDVQLFCVYIYLGVGYHVTANFHISAPPPGFDFYLYATGNNPFCINSFGNTVNMSTATLPADETVEWGYVDQVNLIGPVVYNANGGLSQDFIFSTPSTDYQIYARPRNACGYFNGNIATIDLAVSDLCGGGGLAIRRDSLSGNGRLSGSDVLVVYPNPATNSVALQLPDSLSLNKVVLRVVDVLGRPVKTLKVTSYTTNVDISHLPPGVYFMEIELERGTIIEKVVKL